MATNKNIQNEIKKIFLEVFKKVYNKNRINEILKGNDGDIETIVAKLETSDLFNEFAKKYAISLAQKGLTQQKGLWRQFYEEAKKRHIVALPKTFKEFQDGNIQKMILHNFEMIKSIPSKMLEFMERKYMSTLIEEVAKGKLPRGSFQKMLSKHGVKHANLVARTETSKLQTAIIEYRAKDLGSIIYRWMSSNDSRTRPSHKAMNNVIVFWRPDSQKPLLDDMRGNAGEFPNCRCSIEPIFDEDELTSSNYKVYDYTTDKIVSMTKKQLLEKINKIEGE